MEPALFEFRAWLNGAEETMVAGIVMSDSVDKVPSVIAAVHFAERDAGLAYSFWQLSRPGKLPCALLRSGNVRKGELPVSDPS